jgi:SET domain-containing protein
LVITIITKRDNWITPKIETRQSKIQGRGMFATASIKEGEVCVICGAEYTNTEGAIEAKAKGMSVMRWDEDLYSVEERSEEEQDFINHSCDSNLWMADVFTFVARRDIQVAEEITIDYALFEAVEGEKDWEAKWECRCGSPLCRKKLRGSDWRLPEVQKQYAGHFSPFLNKRIKAYRAK